MSEPTSAALQAENEALRSQLRTILRDHTPQRDERGTAYCPACHNGALDAVQHGTCDTYEEAHIIVAAGVGGDVA